MLTWLTTNGVDEVEAEVEVEVDISTTEREGLEVTSLCQDNAREFADHSLEDDFEDRRPQRRRYEEPLSVTLRKQVLSIAESVSQQNQVLLGGPG